MQERNSGLNTADLNLRFAFDSALGDVLRRHYHMDARGAKLSTKFKLYYRLRPYIPIILRQLLQRNRNQSMDVDDGWFLQSAFLQDWRDALDENRSDTTDDWTIHPWPDNYQYSIVLTHDVETKDGVQLVPALAELEEQYGLRSSWNFIPHKYVIDDGLLNDLKDRGHEVGVHGYNHDGKLFLSKTIFERRAKHINKAIKRFGATGFRAPMVHRDLEWLQALDIDYDASCFDVDPFQAMPGGVGGVWPFFAGRFVELPYTLPQDHTLLIALQETTPRIWLEKLELIAGLSGMAMLITHPDYLDCPSRLGVYRQLLEHFSQLDDAWKTLPQAVAGWWRDRDASSIDSGGSITGSATSRARTTRITDLFSEAARS